MQIDRAPRPGTTRPDENAPTWDDLRVLLAIHRQRSFLGAGKALGTSTSTVGRRIDALEAALGRRLVHRTSAGTGVEPDALPLVALAEQLEQGLAVLRRDDAAASGDAVAGTLRVTTSDGFVRLVTRCLAEIQRAHPRLEIELLSETRQVDLARREADIGVRIGRTSSSAVVQRAAGGARLGLYAAPSYVERRLRAPRMRVRDLPRHDFVGFDVALSHIPSMTWLTEHGAKRFTFRSTSFHAIVEAVQQGLGVAVLSEPVLPGLVRLEVDAPLPMVQVYVAYHRDLRRVPRVRLVVDALTAALRTATLRAAAR